MTLPGSAAGAALRTASDGATIRVAGELDLSTVDTLRAALQPLLAESPASLLIDLAGVEFVDSSGMALLIEVSDTVADLRLVDPSPVFRRLVSMAGLGSVLRMCP